MSHNKTHTPAAPQHSGQYTGRRQTPEAEPTLRAHTTLRIGNMVCPRCIMAVQALLAEEGYGQARVELGSADVEGAIPPGKMELIRRRLEEIGFSLIEDPRECLAELVRVAVIRLARGGRMKRNLSEEIVSEVGHDYSSLSKLFSSRHGCTIERYFIIQKIERVKELLLDSDMPLGEIAEMLGYSSTAYLSAQFKSIEGRTPTDFRRDGSARRNTIDAIYPAGGEKHGTRKIPKKQSTIP